MTDITTVGGLRAAMRAGPESTPLTVWCDGVQVRDCLVAHNIAGCEIRLRTGKPTPTEAETLAEANAMNEPDEPTAAPAAVVTLPADSEPEPDRPARRSHHKKPDAPEVA